MRQGEVVGGRPRGRSLAVVFAALVVAGLTCARATAAPTAAPAGTARIMALGDSITQGSLRASSYRRPLYQQLQQGQFQVDFVGSLDSGVDGNLATDFDRDHEGHWGWRADQLLVQAAGWSAAAQPDIVLLHVGTNDAAQGQSASSTVAEIGQLIDAVRAQEKDVTVLLALIIPANLGAAVTSNIDSINSSLPGLAASKSSAREPVRIVDQASGFSATTDTYDGVHPNATGETKMASRWYGALSTLISTPPPSTTTTTTTTSTTTITTTTSTPGDTVAPVITGVTASAKNQNVTVRWNTNEASTTQVQFRLRGATTWMSTLLDRSLTTSHTDRIDRLTRRTTYEYQVVSVDAAGNRAISTPAAG